jgi:hypothetical protein
MLWRVLAAAATAVVGIGVVVWLLQPADDEAPVRRTLQALVDKVNESTVDGLGPEARANEFGAFFTDDVSVDLGRGSAPIEGRDTLVGMATRLQPRTAAFRLKFVDLGIQMGGSGTAEVHLTAEFIRKSITTGEESLDAREFLLGMRNVGGVWQISRVTAIDTLKR